MAEHWSFVNRLRLDLGKGYTTAEEHVPDPLSVHILVLRTRSDAMLTIVVDVRWLASHVHEPEPATRVEYKHLVANVQRFFARPANLPDARFNWPSTQLYREDLHRALGHRQRTPSSS